MSPLSDKKTLATPDPLPAVIVAVAPVTRCITILPKRARHGAELLHVPPTVRLLGLVRCASKSDEPPPPASRTQIFVAAQPNRFCPAGASVRKYISPTEQVAGNCVPVRNGRV
ncbi:MAG: hypothetical protein ACK5AZ_19420 [Bryobacteraceae bacterium]